MELKLKQKETAIKEIEVKKKEEIKRIKFYINDKIKLRIL